MNALALVEQMEVIHRMTGHVVFWFSNGTGARYQPDRNGWQMWRVIGGCTLYGRESFAMHLEYLYTDLVLESSQHSTS